jgi:glutamyl-tRNA synthetase
MSVTKNHPFVGRLAPSPTGPLHVGHARSFLIAWWQARQACGTLLLRHEDLDVDRSRSAYRDLVRRDLEWLGLDWDGPEWVQSEHVSGIHAAAARLLEQGDAYPCVCSRGDIAAVSAPHAGDAPARYPGTCRDVFASVADAERRTGKLAGVRARTTSREWAFEDLVYGPQRSNVGDEVGDFLILRRDKIPAYQLAVVVDDARQGVTHVVRGHDLLDSTARQLLLYAALGFSPPTFCHVPLVVDDAGVRLAKRTAGLSLRELREQGVDPRRIVQWVAGGLGMGVPELVTPRELVPAFDLARMPRTPVTTPATW